MTWTPADVGTIIPIVAAAVAVIIGAWKLAKVEAHVNSESTSLREQAASKDREIALQREIIAELKSTAALLAQATALGITLPHKPQKVEVVNDAAAPVPVVAA